MNVTLCSNLKSSKISGVDTISAVLQKIKNGHTQQQVTLARTHGRGTPNYEHIKAQIETFTPNAQFIGKRALDNLIGLSGYIYIDVDGFTNKEIFTKTPFIHACWLSVSGQGLGALAKVNGLDINNFKSSWQYLADHFSNNYGVIIDKNTKDISRQNIISYDPDIYINNACTSLNAHQIHCNYSSTLTSNQSPNYSSTVSSKPTPNYVSSSTKGYIDFSSDDDQTEVLERIIYKTILDDYCGLDYVVIEGGRPYRGAFLIKQIQNGKRHSSLFGYTLSILFNNKNITYESLEKLILKANKYHCKTPLDKKEVISMTKWFYEKFITKKLKIDYTLKRIWINPLAILSTKEKKIIIGKESGKLRRKRTLNTIQSTYDELKTSNSKVTQVMVKDSIFNKELILFKALNINKEPKGISIRTIKKRWNEIVK